MKDEKPTDVLGQFYVRGKEGVSWPGVLTFGPGVALRLLVVSENVHEKVPPVLSEVLQGKQVDIIGRSQSRGCITLLSCANTNHKTSTDYSRGVTTTELSFQPTSVWAGPQPFATGESFTHLRMRFDGIHGIIGTKRLAHKLFVKAEERAAVRDVIGDTHEVYYGDESIRHHELRLGDPNAVIFLGSNYSSSFSWTLGDTVSTYDDCQVVAEDGIEGERLVSLGAKIERFLSFICLQTIRSARFEIARVRDREAPDENYERLWYLGDKSKPANLMFHQALSDYFKEASATSAALNRWLSPSDDESLARWLYLDSLDQDVISVGRFISECQAVEIVGRLSATSVPFDKSKFGKAASKAADVIADELGEPYDTSDYRNRFRQLIASGNRSSFRDHIKAFVEGIPRSLRHAFLPDEEAFIGRLVKMRNLLIHMESRTLASEQAEKYLGEMIYRLLALFAAHQGAALGLDHRRMHSGLVNSSVGRAANHFIERGKLRH